LFWLRVSEVSVHDRENMAKQSSSPHGSQEGGQGEGERDERLPASPSSSFA
jgi:hypothetical protein